MISRSELRRLARARLRDSEVLFNQGRYDGAVYLCGYTVELALKARMCQTLKWSGFPSTRKEFEPYQSLRTHNLDTLLSLSGVEAKIKTRFLTLWSAVATWEPEVRYRAIGTATKSDALNMIEAARVLLKVL
jgi:hypothetical protein